MAVIAVLWFIMFLIVPRNLFDVPYSTLVYAREGTMIGARIAPDGQWRFPETEAVPEKFAKCLTTFEDKRFYYHPGVDPAAIARALWSNIRGKRVVSGGSTITMQLARLSRGDRPRTVLEKFKEICWALYIESTTSKKNIIRTYASHAPFGGNVVGIEAAAWRYFGRPASELSWAESATLAVLPNSPALIHPGRNRDALKTKRDGLLLRLNRKGVISDSEYSLAIMEPLPDNPVPLPNLAPHLTERLAAREQGERITSSIDPAMQRQVTAIADRNAAVYSHNHIHNIAVIVADVETGEVLAYAGNVSGEHNILHGTQVDVITSARSTGSVLKPLLYAAMLHDGMILPGTLIADTPLNINGFSPQNYNRTFYGAVPARRAIERSLNVPLVRMLSMYNTGRFLTLLRRAGMTTLPFSEDHYGASLILGGGEGTLWDMAGVYASMARTLNHHAGYSGRYNRDDFHPLTLYPSGNGASATAPIVSVTDKRLSDNGLLSAASIWFAFEAMSDVSRPEEEAEWQQFESMKKVAWKTGTSYGSRDGWAIGVTPRHVVGVWVGNASGEGRSGLTGVGYAGPVLFEVFSLLPSSGWFEAPYGEMEAVAVCPHSGYKASLVCERADTMYIPRAGISTDVCPYHRTVNLSADGRFRVDSSCESTENMIQKSWFVLPPAQEYYYRIHNANYTSLPPFKPGCNPSGRPIDIIYPEHGMELYLPRGFSGRQEMFIFKAAHSSAEATLFWYVDSEFIGQTSDMHEITCSAEPGSHILTVTDQDGHMRRIAFEVK